MGRGSAWMALGRLASPATALALLTLGALRGSQKLRGRALEVLQGRRMLVGPSARVGRIPPGVFSEAAIAERMNLELSAEELDAAYAAAPGPRRDVAILLRTAWVALLGGRARRQGAKTDHFNLFGVVVNNSETPLVLRTVEGIVLSHPNLLVQSLGGVPGPEPSAPAHVCFVNANNFNLALERPEFMRALRAADLVLPDGIGVKIALQMAGGQLRKNLNGTDLFPHLATLFARREWPVFLLGATNAVLEKASANILRHHPELRIAGMHDGYFKREGEEALCAAINASGAMVLLIGMGTPRQEEFVARNQHRLHVAMVFSLGGLLDFLGEKNRRAPLWMRQAGLEWIYRLLQEPGRMWRRYIVGNPVFLWRARQWVRRQRKGG